MQKKFNYLSLCLTIAVMTFLTTQVTSQEDSTNILSFVDIETLNLSSSQKEKTENTKAKTSSINR